MALRIAKIRSEENLRLCYANGLWAMRTNRLRRWVVGDQLAIYVNGRLAALGTVTGPSFRSKERIWKDELYPCRIPMHFTVMIPERMRPEMSAIKPSLVADLGKHWSFHAILVGQPLTGPAIEPILKAMKEASDLRGRRLQPPARRRASWSSSTGKKGRAPLEERLKAYL